MNQIYERKVVLMRLLLLNREKVQFFYDRQSIDTLARMWSEGFFKAASVEIDKDGMSRAMENLEAFADELDQPELLHEAKEVYQRFVLQEVLPMTEDGAYMIYEPPLLKGLVALSDGITGFKVSVDGEHAAKIGNFLREYLTSIVSDEVEEESVIWKTFSWRKKKIAKIIEELIDEGYSANKLEIDQEKVSTIDTHPLLETILAMEQEGSLEVLDLKLFRPPLVVGEPTRRVPRRDKLKIRLKWLNEGKSTSNEAKAYQEEPIMNGLWFRIYITGKLCLWNGKKERQLKNGKTPFKCFKKIIETKEKTVSCLEIEGVDRSNGSSISSTVAKYKSDLSDWRRNLSDEGYISKKVGEKLLFVGNDGSVQLLRPEAKS